MVRNALKVGGETLIEGSAVGVGLALGGPAGAALIVLTVAAAGLHTARQHILREEQKQPVQIRK